jgi:hypothetical protein
MVAPNAAKRGVEFPPAWEPGEAGKGISSGTVIEDGNTPMSERVEKGRNFGETPENLSTQFFSQRQNEHVFVPS